MAKPKEDPQDDLDRCFEKGLNLARTGSSSKSIWSKVIFVTSTLLLGLIFVSLFVLAHSASKPNLKTQLFTSFIDKTAAAGSKNEDEVIKPVIDTKLYRVFELPNQMKVLAISDSKTLSGAAAIRVKVGSFEDPKDMQGLAHFCEHMMFMESKNYPELNGFQSFVSQFGGNTNAFTQEESTNYYFETTLGGFEEGLKRFSDLFTNPIFNKDLMTQEVASIDGELSRNLDDDSWKVRYLVQILSNPESPLSKFNTGSSDSLMNIPLKKGIDVVKKLQDFYDKYYSANLMSLVVIVNQPLDEIEKMVKKTFSSVPNKHRTAPDYSNRTWPFSGDYAHKLVQYIPTSPMRSIQLIFTVKSIDDHPYLNPMTYFNLLLTNKGKGGLSDYLAKKELSPSLSGGSVVQSSQFDIFMIELIFGEEGYKNIEELIKSVFGFIDLIIKEGVREDLYSEFCRIIKNNFNYIPADNSDVMSNLAELASNLRTFPPKYAVSGNRVVNGFDKKVLTDYLSQFNADNLMVLVKHPEFKATTHPKDTSEIQLFELSSHEGVSYLHRKSHTKDIDRIKSLFKTLDLYDSVYHINYGVVDLPESLLAELGKISHKDYPELKILKFSDFIPSDFSLVTHCPLNKLRCKDDFEADAKQTSPKKALENEYVRVWHQLDRSGKSPIIIGDIKFHSPAIQSDLLLVTAANFKKELIQTVLEDELYRMQIAGNSVEINPTSIRIEAFSDVFLDVLASVVQKFKNFDFTEDQYTDALSSLISDLYWKVTDSSYNNLLKYKSKLLLEFFYLELEVYSLLQELTPLDLKQLLFDLYSPLYTEVLFMGNVLELQAIEFGENIAKILDYIPLGPKGIPENRVRNIVGHNFVFRAYDPASNGNQSLILNTYQDGPATYENLGYMNLLVSVMDVEVYTYLRTELQICYFVQTAPEKTRNILSLNVMVESSVMDPHQMDEHIEIALLKTEKKLEALINEDFEALVDSLRATLQETMTLSEKADGYFTHILNQDYDFNLRDKLLTYLPTFTKDGLVKYFKDLVRKPRKLSIQFYNDGYKELPTQTLPKEKQLSNTEAVLITDSADLEALRWFPTSFNPES